MVRRVKLDNGIRVILEHMPILETVSIGFFFTTGSSNETKDENGYTHFIEHMLFKGTNDMTPKEIVRKIEGVGGVFNAFTSRHTTSFYINIIQKYFERALDILGDIILNSTFKDEEIEKERKVIIEELKMSNDSPEEIVSNQFFEYAYAGSSMSFPIGGTISNIENLTRDGVYNYFKNKFNSENLVISIAGNFDMDLALKKISAINLDKKEKNIYEDVQFFYNTKVTEKEELNHIYFSLITKGYKSNNNARYSLNVLSDIFGGTAYSKLFQSIREEKGLCYNIYSATINYINTGTFEIVGSTSLENYEDTLETIYNEVDNLLKTRVTEEEIEEAKESYKSSIAFNKFSANFIMNKNAKNEICNSSYISFEDLSKFIDDVNINSINNSIDEILENKKFFLTAVGPRGCESISNKFSLEYNLN